MLKLLKVTGQSLTPTYQEGDFVFVSKIPFLFISPRQGDVIAFRQPGYGTLIKQIENVRVDGEELYVIGAHPESIDSRTFGPVKRSQIIGKVIWHVHRES